jgi:hypothetical protein
MTSRNSVRSRAVSSNCVFSRGLPLNYFRLGEILRKAKQDGQALGYFQKAHATVESLSKTNPKDLGSAPICPKSR